MVISLGSNTAWKQWAIDAVYQGVLDVNKNKGMAVLWALPEDGPQIPKDADQSIFHTAKWIPQAEALNHPAVKIALIHCGFGSVLEVINEGKPVLAWPGMIDQPHNAKLLEEAGMAINLLSNGSKKASHDPETNKCTYETSVF